MAYDPTKPANNAQVVSLELRTQFQGLHAEIEGRTTPTQCEMLINTYAAGPTQGNIQPLTLNLSDPPTASEVQAVMDKLNELISVLNRP